MTKEQMHIQEVLNDLETFRGRIYFNVELMDDNLLTELVSARIVVKSSGFVEDLARSYGVDPLRILSPTPYTIARIAEVFTFREAALKRTLGNAPNDDGEIDGFERKRQIFQKELDRELAKVTAETFTGGKAAKPFGFALSIPLYRG